MKNKALIVVDVQNDFLPGGSLAVPEGDKIISTINNLLSCYEYVVFTKDWHTPDNIYFASQHEGKKPFEKIILNGKMDTLWPDHCVQNTKGAEISDKLKFMLVNGEIIIIKKGDKPHLHPYSAFGDGLSDTGLNDYLRQNNIEEVDIVGLAFDYCVKDTAISAMDFGFTTTIILNGTKSIGDMDETIDLLKYKGVMFK